MMTSSMMTFAAIVATLGTSIAVASVLSFSVLNRAVNVFISLSVGMMLATSMLHVLPEAFRQIGSPVKLFAVLLAGLFGFFLMEKFSLFRHNHHHEADGHHHDHGHDREAAGPEGWMVLIGHSFHSFTDGILVAAAFMTEIHLGVITCLAILAHEIPQQTGDYIVMMNAGFTRTRSFVYSLCNLALALTGALAGVLMLDAMKGAVPYVLTLASAGFIYIAMSDLIPQMQKKHTVADTLTQAGLVIAGVSVIIFITHIVRHTH